jgi:hypothetical protein
MKKLQGGVITHAGMFEGIVGCTHGAGTTDGRLHLYPTLGSHAFCPDTIDDRPHLQLLDRKTQSRLNQY